MRIKGPLGSSFSIKNPQQYLPLVTFFYIYLIEENLLSFIPLFISFVFLSMHLATIKNLKIIAKEKNLKNVDEISEEALKNKFTIISSVLITFLQLISTIIITIYLENFLGVIIFLTNIGYLTYFIYFSLLRKELVSKYTKKYTKKKNE